MTNSYKKVMFGKGSLLKFVMKIFQMSQNTTKFYKLFPSFIATQNIRAFKYQYSILKTNNKVS